MRIGILGTARIAGLAVVRPGRRIATVAVSAVASRDPERARAYARQHGIERVHESYESLVRDPELDAVYIPLPNSMHAEWTVAALKAGKHVLCEKPFASNALEATAVAERAARSGLVAMEAFHWRYHPLARRMVEIVRSGAIGAPRLVDAWVAVPIPRRSDVRWQPQLSGGSTMDMGCYAVNILRHVMGSEPRVVAASARLRAPGVDSRMQADLIFPGGIEGRLYCNMLSPRVRIGCRVVGDEGELRVRNPVVPQFFHRLTVRRPVRRPEREHFGRTPTYDYQLRAFAAAVRSGAPLPTGADDAVANMRVLDAIYRAAGMEPRG